MLARWSGWGAVPAVFDDTDDRHGEERGELRALLRTQDAWAQARRTTLNAHYTSASVVQAMWRAVEGLGFDGTGRVLEPGCGSGNFIGFAPDGASLTGVELDATTAVIARHLYGARATIHPIGFEELRVDDGTFDLVIGNVPFAKVTPHDPRHNRGRHALHNYFLLKSLHLTRPGGVVVALTSRYTLDARNPAVRREMAGLADLVGAVRLPERAFAASSGTDVVVDLLVLRRRLPGHDPTGPPWARTVPAALDVDTAGETLDVNEYFDAHPDRILGHLTAGRGMYRDHELTVTPTGDLDEQLPAALADLVADAHTTGLTLTPAVAAPALVTASTVVAVAVGEFDLEFAQDLSFVTDGHGRIGRLSNGEVHTYTPRVAKDRSELARLVEMRDAARAVLSVQTRGGSNEDLTDAQDQLTERYEAYVRIYGPINRSTQARTGRRDPQTGTEVTRRLRPRMGGFRDDPDWPLVAALEVFDDDTQTARPAAIFTERIIDPPHQRLGVDTPDEAVAVCLDETGTVTLDRVAELLGTDADNARRRLGQLVYDDPTSTALVPAAEYLSGNIRHKLTTARTAATVNPALTLNVAALESVLPRQLEPTEITARLGAPWIAATDIEAFCRDVLDTTVDVERLAELGSWSARLRNGSRRSVALSSEWGTARADAVTLLDAALNQRLHTVTDATDDGRRVRNDAETLAARDKQEALSNRFSIWVWEDPARSDRLAERYNELFSSTVLPTHDGSHLTLPGLAADFDPRGHQRDAVARILTDGRALLAHAVGAGKTATMVIAAMEQRRLGSVSKPAVVVPNHMLEQFSREWLQLYPTARILVADRERLSKARRKEFVARAATGDWDGIIFSHAGFARIGLGPDLMRGYLGEEVETARRALSASQDGKGLSVKRLERRIAQLEENRKRLLAEHTKDDGVRFEETGVDYLYVDEAHAFKNRQVDSSIDGIGGTGSQRAQDLDSKLWALRRMHGPRVVTFATATPVANSMAELWVMQSYLHPDLLADVDLRAFDAWAATFGRTHTALELAPDGSSYRMQTRFARFQNVPELLTLYRQVADVRTTDDLDLPTPSLTGGKAETVVVDPSERLVDYVADLASRAERVRNRVVDPSEDNMLKVTGDGRRAALDLRLVGEPADTSGGKLATAAARIAGIHHATRDNTYADEGGQLTIRPGALQLVFCDVSTPAGDGWNAYHELRDLLARRGVDRDQIRYMQTAATDVAKAKLFASCRDGTVAVLVGSTETMGVGTNVQARAVALHHLDAPWRPSDIEQRDGRILRQGNQNPEVQVIRYVTEGSFDTYMWQTLERKAAFIAQVTRGDLPDRDVDDIGDQALSFAEVKALATGDPLVLEKAAVDADVARLARLERAHHDDQHRLRRTYETAITRAERAEQRAATLTDTIGRLVDTRGDRFAMTIDGRSHTKRVDAGEHLQHLLQGRLDQAPPETNGPPSRIGTLGGLVVHAQALTTIEDEVRVSVPDAHVDVRLLANDLSRSDPSNLVTRLERHIHRLPDTIAELNQEASAARAEADRAGVRIGVAWDRAEELAGLRRRQKETDEQLEATTEPIQKQQESVKATGPRTRPAEPSPPSLSGRSVADVAAPVRMTARLAAIQHQSSADPPGVEL
ncbi:MAG: DEAD/DEAH box helicase family protein [Acidimicrobiia bacterium]|nr:DEAD/DEAH box helicase family protein [Acidimicrobiia bacterium]